MSQPNKIYTIGIMGVRGYVGTELLKLVHNHPQLSLQWVSSRSLCGQSVKVLAPELNELAITDLTPEQLGQQSTDIIVLALPNGLAAPYVKAIEQNQSAKIVIDLSADYRFDDHWVYSLPELNADQLKPNNLTRKTDPLLKISNPGCYATAMQLALAPIIDQITATPHCFGISGYSGAGTTPNANNDPKRLKDNILPYGLVEHLHEKEVSTRLNKAVSFSPHVAEFFSGINMTIQVELSHSTTKEELLECYKNFYQHDKLVTCQTDTPNIQQVVNTAHCVIGGFTLSSDGKRATIVSCIDNLLKGAATQAMQNINIGLGIEHTTGMKDKQTLTSQTKNNWSKK